MKALSRAGLALVPLLAACGGGSGGGAGTGTLQVRMHDTAVEAADAVFVTIERVEVFRTDESGAEVKETLLDVPQQWDLLALQNGVEAVLGTESFPIGDYSSIRLVVAEDSKQDIESMPAEDLQNYIVVDGVAYPLVVPSGTQTGIKFNHQFSLSADAITTLTFDFDVRKSVHRRGTTDVYSLRPTLRLVDTVVSGTVSGTVSTASGDPIPDGTVVSAQQGGVEVASAIVDVGTGAYQIGPLLEGTYDLVAIAPGYDPLTETGVEVVRQTDSPNHDFVLESADTGTIEGTVLPANDTIVVTLLQDGVVVQTVDADPVSGDYAFLGVPVGMYTVRAENEGAVLEVDEVEIFAAGDVLDVDFGF
jgi:hypothetical protein